MPHRTEVEEYESTVVYRALLFYHSVFLRRLEKKPYSQLTPNFFVVLSFLFVFYNFVFPRMSHIYQFCSIITCSMVKFAVIPFYNSSFYVHSSGVPERYIRYHKMMHIYASNLQDPSNLHVAGGFNGKLTSTN